MFGIILVGVAALCAFTFPAFLIDAIKEEDAETSKTARKMSCVTFGIFNANYRRLDDITSLVKQNPLSKSAKRVFSVICKIS